jgi:hypothetical protein
MKNLSIAMLAALALLSLGGCKKKGGGSDDTTAKLGEFKDRMCKCADKACADKVTDDMTKWGQEAAKTMESDVKPNEDDAKKRQAINEDLIKCQQKLISAATPNPATPPPPAGDKPADTAAAPPPGDKPADPGAAPAAPAPAAGDKPAAGSN